MVHRAEQQPKPLIVEDQREGLAAIEDRATAELYVQQWQGVVQRKQQELKQQQPFWRKAYEKARQWLRREENLETELVQLSIRLSDVLDQLHHSSDEQVKQHLVKQLADIERRYTEMMGATTQLEQTHSPEATETTEQYPITVAGQMKNWKGDLAERTGKLGQYGQDCVRMNTELGIGVVADGTSNGIDSFEVARRTSRRAQAILEDIPIELCRSLGEVEFYVNGEITSLLEEIRHLPVESRGATTVLAARYLEKFDAIVMIDIGDCEGVVVVDDMVEPLKPALEHSNDTDAIVKGRHELENGSVQTTVDFIRITDRPFVHSYHLGDIRKRKPGQPIRMLLATDGLQNNSGKTLRDMAHDIVQQGAAAVVKDQEVFITLDSGKVVGPTQEDDMVIVDMTIPARLLEQSASEAA